MPGSDPCLVVADLLEEMGDPNSEIVRDSRLVDTGNFGGNASNRYVARGIAFGEGDGDGNGDGWGDGSGDGDVGEGYGEGSGLAWGGGDGDGWGNCSNRDATP